MQGSLFPPGCLSSPPAHPLRLPSRLLPSEGWPGCFQMTSCFIWLVLCNVGTQSISMLCFINVKHRSISLSYQRGEVGSKVAVHTFPNLPDCLDLHLKQNHRVLKQSTCNPSLKIQTTRISFKMQSYRNKTHQRQKIYKQSPRPEERWARQLEYWEEKNETHGLLW